MSQTIAQQFAEARARAGKAAGTDTDGIRIARDLAADVDRILCAEAGPLVAKCETKVAVLATGGFGRSELAPFSDLDLLVLCAERPGRAAQALAEAILYPLWDAKVDAGHAVRPFDQALALPATDLAAATALLDARFLLGDRPLAEKFLAEFHKRVAATAADDFVARLRAEQKARHSRFGDTIFLLEPDLKNGPGGMRDLCVGRWAAMARFGTGEPRELQAKGVMTERVAAAFQSARSWLLRTRIAMHDAAGRRQDQLRFALQEAAAPILCADARASKGDIRPAVAPAVEALMHQFHAHAKLVRRETERLLQRATARDDQRRPTVPVALAGSHHRRDPSFVIREGALEPFDEAVFPRKPSEMLRIFSAAIELDLPLALRARESIAEQAASNGEALRADPDAGPTFIKFLCDTRDRANPSRLEQMQDLGLLAALMPEWEPSTGRVQHDIYHVYTVDQHALYAVGRLHALARGDHADEYPVTSETIQEVQRPIALAVGTLLHDVGKPYGKPHSVIGADLTVKIAGRLGLAVEDISRADFLVRQHLVMGQMSQRRDLEDQEMIADFAQLCGDEENLRELYLLTFCDLASVAPDNLTSWKETLLRELYQRTLNFLRRGPDLLGAERAEIVQRRQKRAARLLGEEEDNPELAAMFSGFPDRYFAENTARKIAAHVGLMRAGRAGKSKSVIDVTHDNHLGMTEMVLVAPDSPGLLAEVAGVLHANRLEVVDAAIYSRKSTTPDEQRRDAGGLAPARRFGVRLAHARGADGAEDRQPGQPRLHRGRGDLRGSPRPAVRHHAHPVRQRAGHPPIKDRHRGQPRRRRLLRTRQGHRRQDHRQRPDGGPARVPAGLAPALDDKLSGMLILFLLALLDPIAGDGAAGGKAVPFLEKGQALFKAGDLDGALAAFNAAAAADPKDARAPYLRGVTLEKRGDAGGAIAAYKAALARRPAFAEASNNLGALLLAKGDAGGAAAALEAATKANPDYAEAHYNLGLARDAEGKRAEAVTAYREAVRLKPGDGGYRLNLGAALRRTGDVDGAVAALKEATRLSPNDALAFADLGMVLSDQRAFDDAQKALEKATKLNPNLALAWDRLGRVILKKGDAAGAVTAGEKARRLEPSNAGYAADLCRSLFELRQAARAVAECRAAVALDPKNPLARYELGKALVAQGDCAGATAELEHFAALPGIKPEAKAQAQTIARSCIRGAGKPAK